jgi:hypothetical protein
MEILSKEYGWTPNEIKETSVDDIQNYLDIMEQRKKLSNQNG